MPTSKGNPAESAFRYPWTMAPTMNMTKPVTTAIATFVSIDKFIIFPFNYGGNPPRRPLFWILLLLYRFGFRRAYGRQASEVRHGEWSRQGCERHRWEKNGGRVLTPNSESLREQESSQAGYLTFGS